MLIFSYGDRIIKGLFNLCRWLSSPDLFITFYYSPAPSGLKFSQVKRKLSQWNLTCYCDEGLNQTRTMSAKFVVTSETLFLKVVAKYVEVYSRNLPILDIFWPRNRWNEKKSLVLVLKENLLLVFFILIPSTHSFPLHHLSCLKLNCRPWKAAAACAGRPATWPATIKSCPWSKSPARHPPDTCRRSSTSQRSTSRK